MSVIAGSPDYLITLQDAQTTGNGNIIACNPTVENHAIYIKGDGTIGAGAIQIESADAFDYSGTWAAIGGGPVTVVSDSELIVNFTGAYRFLRARISTTITTTTVTVKYQGNR